MAQDERDSTTTDAMLRELAQQAYEVTACPRLAASQPEGFDLEAQAARFRAWLNERISQGTP
jgi:hypothetical protein